MKLPKTQLDCRVACIKLLDDIAAIDEQLKVVRPIPKDERTIEEQALYRKLMSAKLRRMEKLKVIRDHAKVLKQADHEERMRRQDEEAHLRRQSNIRESQHRDRLLVLELRRLVTHEQFQRACEAADLAFLQTVNQDTF